MCLYIAENPPQVLKQEPYEELAKFGLKQSIINVHALQKIKQLACEEDAIVLMWNWTRC